MRIRKYYNEFELVLELLDNETEIVFEQTIMDILQAFDNTTLLNSNIEFNDLIKLQQSNPRHILIPYEIKPFDNMKIILKLLNNFFKVTNQSHLFMIESLTKRDEIELIAYGSEIYLEPINKMSFSPSTRMKWVDPQLINKIISIK